MVDIFGKTKRARCLVSASFVSDSPEGLTLAPSPPLLAVSVRGEGKTGLNLFAGPASFSPRLPAASVLPDRDDMSVMVERFDDAFRTECATPSGHSQQSMLVAAQQRTLRS